MKILKAFTLAFNMLTIIPFFKVHNFEKGINGYAAMFYPLIGLLLGFALWGVYSLLQPYMPHLHLLVFIFVLWVVLTGALHLDGLSDTIDGLFVKKEQTLEAMKDSHVGGMGMIFTALFLIFKLSSLFYVANQQLLYLLPLVLLLSRLNATLAIYFFAYISSGVGSLIKEELQIKHLLFALTYSAIALYFFDQFLLALVSLVGFLLIAKFFTSKLDGLNGDIYGFIIELTELLMLNYLIIKHFS